MSSLLSPHKSDIGWVIEIPDEMAERMSIAAGSLAVLYPTMGALEVEVLPPPTPELEATVERIHHKYKDAFAEMKRRGD